METFRPSLTQNTQLAPLFSFLGNSCRYVCDELLIIWHLLRYLTVFKSKECHGSGGKTEDDNYTRFENVLKTILFSPVATFRLKCFAKAAKNWMNYIATQPPQTLVAFLSWSQRWGIGPTACLLNSIWFAVIVFKKASLGRGSHPLNELDRNNECCVLIRRKETNGTQLPADVVRVGILAQDVFIRTSGPDEGL